jgi:hypothetical protein
VPRGRVGGDTCKAQKAICAFGEDWVGTFEDFATEAEQILDLADVAGSLSRLSEREARSRGSRAERGPSVRRADVLRVGQIGCVACKR